MTQQKYYPEEILVGKIQGSKYGWLGHINHFSVEWQEEYAHYCEEKGLTVCEDSAAGFVRFRDEQLKAAMKYGNAQ